jgi:hypothetical protein
MKITKNILREIIEAEMSSLNESIRGNRDQQNVDKLSGFLVNNREADFLNLFDARFKTLNADDFKNHPDLFRIFADAQSLGWAADNHDLADVMLDVPWLDQTLVDRAQA